MIGKMKGWLPALGQYILDENHQPVPVDHLTWSDWFATANRRVARDELEQLDAEPIVISTVFLGLDHNFSGRGDPLLWETMVFGLPNGDDYQKRFTREDHAVEYHRELLRQLRERLL